jgi:hypothetical protein
LACSLKALYLKVSGVRDYRLKPMGKKTVVSLRICLQDWNYVIPSKLELDRFQNSLAVAGDEKEGKAVLELDCVQDSLAAANLLADFAFPGGMGCCLCSPVWVVPKGRGRLSLDCCF